MSLLSLHFSKDNTHNMYELSLFGQVSGSRHDQVLKVLAGVAAMPPRILHERHLVFKPTKPPLRRPVQVGGSQGIQDAQKAAKQAQNTGDLYYLRLVETLGTTEHAHDSTKTNTKAPETKAVASDSKWNIIFYDVPEAGKRPVTARMMSSTSVVDGDPIGFMEGLGYRCVHQFVTQGHQLVRHNTVIYLHQVLQYPLVNPRQPFIEADALRNAASLHSLELVDKSEAYTLQAYVRILDGSKPESMNRGMAELGVLKEMMKGCVDLRPVDRLALDTRVK